MAEHAGLIQWLSTLGVGGVLAALIFLAYRKDMRQQADVWRLTSDQLMTVVKENTASLARVITMLEMQERTTLRRQDGGARVTGTLDGPSRIP